MSLNDLINLDQFTALTLAATAEEVLVHGELQNTDKTCPECGKEALKPHQYYERRVRHLPVMERPTYLAFERKDWICECGRVFLERLDFQDLKSQYTCAYEGYLYKQCIHMPIETVAKREQLHWDVVARIFKKNSLQERAGTRQSRCWKLNHTALGRDFNEERVWAV
jgi:transposase